MNSRPLPDNPQPVPWGDLALGLIAFALLPNATYWVFNYDLNIDRAWINLDFLLLGAAAFFLPRALLLPLYVLLALLDMLANIAGIFHFTPDEMLFSLRSAGNLAFDWALFPLLPGLVWAAALLGGLALLAVWRPQRRFVPALLSLLLLPTVAAADFANGTSYGLEPARYEALLERAGIAHHRGLTALRLNIATSGALHFHKTFVTAARPDPNPHWTPMESATGAALGGPPAQAAPGHNLVLVIVESMGVLQSEPHAWERILAPLQDPAVQQRYAIRQGSVRFRGGTTHGELRELCGVDGEFRNLEAGKPLCLPQILSKQGFQTVAIHGFAPSMFARDGWWPLAGFRKTLFRDALARQPGARFCGVAFHGICDDFAVQAAAPFLRGPQKSFVYVLTLNSHLPIQRQTAAEQHFSCEGLDETQCSLAATWRNVFQSVAQLAESDIRNTQFVIVGDHAPPLWSRASAQLFQPRLVPYVILDPR